MKLRETHGRDRRLRLEIAEEATVVAKGLAAGAWAVLDVIGPEARAAILRSLADPFPGGGSRAGDTGRSVTQRTGHSPGSPQSLQKRAPGEAWRRSSQRSAGGRDTRPVRGHPALRTSR
jgi:hypothetical protein